ncbi:MAG: pantoate--beta-alanine ligase [Actinomycetota bacterium]
MIATGRITEVRKILEVERSDGKRVGFVPTMGALHEGHRSLIRRARAESDFVVVSIYVNPTQFNRSADLHAYPRSFADDLEACAAEGADLVFHPDDDEMYPRRSLTTVTVREITDPMEGASRPGHFAGVGLVCTKLFNIVGPCTAYFGEKDAQQLRVVRRITLDLDQPVEIIACPTVRDEDGLALSSRNARLRSEDRSRALALPRALRAIGERVGNGERDVATLEAAGRAVLERSELDGIDYLEIVDADTLEHLETVKGTALVCGAVHVGDVRLIDNMLVGSPEEE